jgi:hypothetical protein
MFYEHAMANIAGKEVDYDVEPGLLDEVYKDTQVTKEGYRVINR